MPNVMLDQPPCVFCGKTHRVSGDAGSVACQLCVALDNALLRVGRTLPRRYRYDNWCERCGKNCKGARCAKCRLVVACSKCGGDAHIGSANYGNPDATAVCRKCGWSKRAKPDPRPCDVCGNVFTPTDDSAQLCSKKCIGVAVGRKLRKHPDQTCEMCGGSFACRPSDTGRFCSRVCADEWRHRRKRERQRPPSSLVRFPPCKQCGRVFCARANSARYCSDECRRLWGIEVSRVRANDLYALATQFDKVTGAYVGAEWRQRLFHALVDRDGDKCGICHRKVNLKLKSGTRGSRRGPSVDHIIPRSQGGSDDLVNLRLTHWGCNQKRGNRGGGEQLALVG